MKLSFTIILISFIFSNCSSKQTLTEDIIDIAFDSALGIDNSFEAKQKRKNECYNKNDYPDCRISNYELKNTRF